MWIKDAENRYFKAIVKLLTAYEDSDCNPAVLHERLRNAELVIQNAKLAPAARRRERIYEELMSLGTEFESLAEEIESEKEN